MSHAIIRVTHLGAQKTGEQYAYGRCFQLKYFMLGSAGHDTGTLLAVVPDPTLVSLPAPVTNMLPFGTGAAYQVGPTTTEFKLVLGPGVGSGTFSSVGIFGEIVNVVDTVNDSGLIGTTFLYGIANMPMQNKLTSESKTLTLRLNNI